MTHSVRLAEPADEPFIAAMLAQALDWRPGSAVRDLSAVRADPAVAKYVVGWGARTGDLGVVATVADDGPGTGAAEADDGPSAGAKLADDGQGAVAVGAAWLRFHSADDPGYGFVDADTPELGVGVVADHRGRGVGTALVERLLAEASDRGISAVSLSVERSNPAAGLYRRLGFVTTAAVGDADTMVRRLS